MTCIVAFIKGKKVYMAGDRAVSSEYAKSLVKTPKVFRVGQFMAGGAGSATPIQDLQYHWKPPRRPKGMSTETYIYKKVAVSLYETLGTLDDESFQAILVYKGRIFEVQQDMSILEHQSPVLSIGTEVTMALQLLLEYENDVSFILRKLFTMVSEITPGVSESHDCIQEKIK